MKLGVLLNYIENCLMEGKMNRDAEVYLDGWELDHATVGVCLLSKTPGLFLVSVEQAEEDEEDEE